MKQKLMDWLEFVQQVINLHGGTWLALFTAFILFRIVMVLRGHPPLTMSESGAYSMAIGAFAATNIGKPGGHA